MKTIEVIASKKSTAKFTITAATRLEAEQAIATKLISNKDIVWQDGSDGVNVACISGTEIWKPRKRFFPENDGGDDV